MKGSEREFCGRNPQRSDGTRLGWADPTGYIMERSDATVPTGLAFLVQGKDTGWSGLEAKNSVYLLRISVGGARPRALGSRVTWIRKIRLPKRSSARSLSPMPYPENRRFSERFSSGTSSSPFIRAAHQICVEPRSVSKGLRSSDRRHGPGSATPATDEPHFSVSNRVHPWLTPREAVRTRLSTPGPGILNDASIAAGRVALSAEAVAGAGQQRASTTPALAAREAVLGPVAA